MSWDSLAGSSRLPSPSRLPNTPVPQIPANATNATANITISHRALLTAISHQANMSRPYVFLQAGLLVRTVEAIRKHFRAVTIVTSPSQTKIDHACYARAAAPRVHHREHRSVRA